MKRLGTTLVIYTVLQFAQCFPASDHFITISNNDPFTHTTPETTAVNNEPELYSMRVNTDVHYRYATTVVSSRVANPANYSQEVVFSIVIPETAFISGFLMEIDGKVYKAYVKEKKAAKQEYDAAVQIGTGAAHVAVSARDSNRFTVNVNVEALSKATFNLTYEELLTRRLEVYNLVINLHLNQIVRDLSVDVNILENSKINVLRTPVLRSGNEVDADENTESNSIAKIEFKNDKKTTAHVSFNPTIDQQKQLIKSNEKKNTQNEHKDGIYGQFVVQYDVERDSQGGEIMIYDGYFVHFFAPNELKPLNKYVIFVLDISGSMYGRKIEQLREAMLAILADIKEGDYFDIIEFSDRGKVFKITDAMETVGYNHFIPIKFSEKVSTEPYAATKYNINRANNFINYLNIDYYGGTNIYDALNTVLNVSKSGMNTLLAKKTSNTTLPEPLIIFLTDGEPTVGETDTEKIISMVSELNFGDKKTPIFSLAFGEDADRRFLKELALRNSGFMKHIYEAADASLQLQHFYKQISSLLITDVKFKYPADQVEEASITDHGFPNLFSGSELVVAGRMNKQDIHPQVSGYSIRGPTDFTPKIVPVLSSETENKPSLERLWAYLTIKQLLDKKDLHADSVVPTTDEENKETLETKALRLALKYSFVTPLTSLIVVKPNITSAVDAESEKEKQYVSPTGIIHSPRQQYGPVSSPSFAVMPPTGQQHAFGASGTIPSLPGSSYGQPYGPIGPFSSQSSASIPSSLGSSYGQHYAFGTSGTTLSSTGSSNGQYLPGSYAIIPPSKISSYGQQLGSSQSSAIIPSSAGGSYGQQYIPGTSQSSTFTSTLPGDSYGTYGQQYGPIGPIPSRSLAIMPTSVGSSYGQQFSPGYSQSSPIISSSGGGSYAQQYIPGSSQSSASMPSSPGNSYGPHYGPFGPVSSRSSAISPTSIGSSYGQQFSPGYSQSSPIMPSSGGGSYAQQYIPGSSQSSASMPSSPGNSYGLQYGPFGPVSSQKSPIKLPSAESSYEQQFAHGYSQSSVTKESTADKSYGQRYVPGNSQISSFVPSSPGSSYGQQYGPVGPFSSQGSVSMPPSAGRSYGQIAPGYSQRSPILPSYIPGASQSSASMPSWSGSFYGHQQYIPRASQSSASMPSWSGSSYGHQQYIPGASQSSASMPSWPGSSYGVQYVSFGPVSSQNPATMPPLVEGYYGQQFGSFSSHRSAIIQPTAGSSYGGFDGTLHAKFIVTPRLQDQLTPHFPQHTETSTRVDLFTFALGQLTWLQDYTVEPDSIQIPNGVYKLGVLKNITDFSACKLPENKNGTCVFLPSCSKVFSQLVNLDSYMPMFCHILDYAGVCCPDEN